MARDPLEYHILQSDPQYILAEHDERRDVESCVGGGRTMGTVPRQLPGTRTLDGHLQGTARRPHVRGVYVPSQRELQASQQLGAQS